MTLLYGINFLILAVTPYEFPKSVGRFNLEYVSANPTGPLHIGHGRWAVIGSVLASLMQYVGADVRTEFYVNDAGNQINLFKSSVESVKNDEPIPENGYHGSYISDLSNSDKDPLELMLIIQKETLSRIGVNFDLWFSEKSLHDSNSLKRTLDILLESGDAYKKDSAIWFKSTAYGDDKDRVLVKSDNSMTYFLADIAYHRNKLERGFTHLINIWGADHHGYVPRVKAALSALLSRSNCPLTVIIGQLVSLRRDGQPVRMSKRTGEMITLDEVVDEIGVDATRYFLIHKSQDTSLDFDLTLAKSQSSDNPVFYIQYAYARICTLLSKFDKSSLPELAKLTSLHKSERNLITLSLQVYDELWLASKNLNPSKVAHYVYDLAKSFHYFYETCPIHSAADNLKSQRYTVLVQVQYVIGICLDILGITKQESM